MENDKELLQLIGNYKQYKSDADRFKKQADIYNKQIKDIMKASGLTEAFGEDTKVTYVTSFRQEFVEEALIATLKQLKVKGVIKKKEYVDMDALETAIYNGELSAADLAPCQVTKEVVTLRMSPIKK